MDTLFTKERLTEFAEEVDSQVRVQEFSSLADFMLAANGGFNGPDCSMKRVE